MSTTKQYRLSVRFRFPAGDGFAESETTKVLRGHHRSLAAIERKKLLYGLEPWRAYKPNATATDYACCDGWECGCGGLTNAQATAERRKGFTGEVIGFEVHERTVTRWTLKRPMSELRAKGDRVNIPGPDAKRYPEGITIENRGPQPILHPLMDGDDEEELTEAQIAETIRNAPWLFHFSAVVNGREMGSILNLPANLFNEPNFPLADFLCEEAVLVFAEDDA